MNEAERGWLAGIIDGEGCISVGKHAHKKGKTSYSLTIVVAMTHEPTVQRCRDLAGGIGPIYFRTRANPRCNHQYAWSPRGVDALRVLDLVGGLMFTKAAEVEVARRFGRTMYMKNRALHPLRDQIRQECFEQARDLKSYRQALLRLDHSQVTDAVDVSLV